ncbi:MAG: hypothetical protein FWH07_08145 [Oscillospiraceae bacterium]|nr:hypothetical protein [Oscillospiraceae bacterium]
MVTESVLKIILVLSLSLILTACGTDEARDAVLKIGHGGGYLSATIYAAEYDADFSQFHSSSDIGYALLAGTLDAGFIETDKLTAFSMLSGFERLTVAGVITYPYGAVVVLRKGLDNRLQELGGLTIAARSPDCALLQTFITDAQRLNADLSQVNYSYMAFDAMLPALEAGIVDAAVIKGHYSVTAQAEGHLVLYQNWEVAAGDECCPPIIDQTILVLLVRRDKSEQAEVFTDALTATGLLAPDKLRHAVADNTAIRFETLQNHPVPEFSTADDGLILSLGEHDHE